MTVHPTAPGEPSKMNFHTPATSAPTEIMRDEANADSPETLPSSCRHHDCFLGSSRHASGVSKETVMVPLQGKQSNSTLTPTGKGELLERNNLRIALHRLRGAPV